MAVQLRKDFPAIGGKESFKSLFFEYLPGGFPELGFIVNHQHFFFGGHVAWLL
jgi:hypothetical protein